MTDIAEVTKAIEASTTAFEAFKKINDSKHLTLAEKTEQLSKAFDDVHAETKKIQEYQAQQKALIETLEAKANRPQFGADGKQVDEVAEEHRKAFGEYLRKGKEENLRGLEQKALAASTNSGADGGYAVPKVIDAAIAALAVNISPIRQLAEVVQVSTPQFHKLVNLRGTASGWVSDTAARTATNSPQMADVQPTFGELYANLQCTQQLLDDAFFDVEQWVAENITTEFARAEGAAFIVGNGSNQPTGFLDGTPVTTVDASRAFGTLQYVPTGKAGAWADTNPGDALITLVSTMKAAYRQGAVFVTNKAQLFEISAFKDSGGRYIFNPVTAPTLPPTILGYPVVEAEDMPTKAANSFSVAFGNFRLGYIIADRVGTRMIRDPFSNKPYIGFYVTKRLGGAVVNSEAIKVLKFSAT